MLWIPNESLKLVFNSYAIGQDNLAPAATRRSAGTTDTLVSRKMAATQAAIGSAWAPNAPVNWANVKRIHEDDSILVKYYDAKARAAPGVSEWRSASRWTSAANTAAA